MSRISDNFTEGNNYPTKLCFCRDCTFAFFDYRLSDEEAARLYSDYRDEDYQKTREHYECWYTKKVNDALNYNARSLHDQQKNIERMISQNVHRELRTALDYGGNEGRTFTGIIGTNKKYVFDISGITPIEGVQRISSYEELKQYSFDFIMCNHLFEHLSDPMTMMQNLRNIGNSETIYYIEVPSENPFTQKANKYSIRKNFSLLFNPNFNIWLLAKHYFKMKRLPFMPMGEHLNFFTKKSISTMAEQSGFTVIDVQENIEHFALGNWLILSMMFKL